MALHTIVGGKEGGGEREIDIDKCIERLIEREKVEYKMGEGEVK